MLLVLVVSYYPTFIYLHNIYEISFWEYLILTSALCLPVILLYFFIGRKIENRLNLFLILIALHFTIFYGGVFIKTGQFDINSLFNAKALILFMTFIAIFIPLIICEIKPSFKKILQIFVCVLYLSLFISQGQSIFTYLVSLISHNEKVTVNNTLSDTPNFYFIIPDMYPNSKMMKKYMEADNSEFVNFLKEKGFYVIENSTSNYSFTYQSLPSMLNYSYLNELNVRENQKDARYMSVAADIYKKNKLFKLFKQKNYKIFFLNSDSLICAKPDNTDFIFTNNYFNTPISIISLFIDKSIFTNTKLDGNLIHYNNIKTSFKHLNEVILNNKTERKFVFAHLLVPHIPFVFDRNGDYNLKEKDFQKEDKDKNIKILNLNSGGYYEQILYVNSQLETLISNILETDKHAVILITSDHAVNITLNIKNNYDIKDDYEHLHQRFNNFMAVYTFDKNYKNFYETMTPISAIRTILNQYYGEKLPIIDKIYVTSYPENYNPEDVTELVQKKIKESYR